MLVNQNGTLNASNFYYPYGGSRGGAQSTLTAKRYTGQYHGSGLAGSEGLYYYNARWYDPQLARFAQADTIVPDPGSAMAFNRYMYVAGNPLRLVDPTGHFGMLATAAIGGVIGGAVGLGMYAVNIARSGQAFDIKEAAVATGTMAVAGALVGTGIGAAQGLSMAAATAVTIGTSTGMGIAAGGAGYVAANTFTGSEFKTADFAISSAIGGATGAVGQGFVMGRGAVAVTSGVANVVQYEAIRVSNGQGLALDSGAAASFATGLVAGRFAGGYSSAAKMTTSHSTPVFTNVRTWSTSQRVILSELRKSLAKKAAPNVFRSAAASTFANLPIEAFLSGIHTLSPMRTLPRSTSFSTQAITNWGNMRQQLRYQSGGFI